MINFVVIPGKSFVCVSDNSWRKCMFVAVLVQVLKKAESHFQPGKGYPATVINVIDDKTLELSLIGISHISTL